LVKKWNGESDTRAGGGPGSPVLRQLTLRGKFKVTDPAVVKRLALNLVFRGGAIIYLNGKEVTRAFMPAGKAERGPPSEIYPEAAYLKPDGSPWHWYNDRKTMVTDCHPLRLRKLTGVEVPAALLRQGINILGVEIHAAPHLLPSKGVDKNWQPQWGTCGLVELHLQAESTAGLVPNVVRPSGVQVWNVDITDAICDVEYGDPSEALRPISIVGARNGCFSGQVAVSSDKPINGLKAKIGDLSTADGKKIPASAVELGYGKFDVSPGSRWGGTVDEAGVRYPGIQNVRRQQAILTAPPAEVPVRTLRLNEAERKKDGLPPYVNGAYLPVWVLVNVPKDAAAGDYQGALTIGMEGGKPVEVPVKLKVVDWTLPDPANYIFWAGFIESPEGAAQPYNIPLWSDKNWEYAARSLEYLGKIGNKVLYIMAAAESQYGNAEGMVRWTKGEDGKYTYDFSRVEKYVDLALKKMGKPHFVVIGVWDSCSHVSVPAGKKRKCPRFTVEDAKTHAVTTEDGPQHGTPENETFWRPVLTGIKEILDKRGLSRAMLLGYCADVQPDRKTVGVFDNILPTVGWQSTNHSPIGSGRLNHAGGTVPILYLANVWGAWSVPYPQQGRNYGWRYKARDDDPRTIRVWLDRGWYDASPLPVFRFFSEKLMQADRHGIGQAGADLWDKRDKQGNVSSLMVGRFPGTSEGNLGAYLANALYPGPDGPVPTVAWQNMRENIEECEARIFLEKLLVDKKLPADLAKKCQDVLDERTIWHKHWAVHPAERLFGAASEAAKVTEGK
jgi:hypothetical protein